MHPNRRLLKSGCRGFRSGEDPPPAQEKSFNEQFVEAKHFFFFFALTSRATRLRSLCLSGPVHSVLQLPCVALSLAPPHDVDAGKTMFCYAIDLANSPWTHGGGIKFQHWFVRDESSMGGVYISAEVIVTFQLIHFFFLALIRLMLFWKAALHLTSLWCSPDSSTPQGAR